MSLVNENSSLIATLACRLNYLDTKDQFKWYADFKDLICLVKALLEFTEDGKISEDAAHKMFSFKVGDIIVKYHSEFFNSYCPNPRFWLRYLARKTMLNLFAPA